MSITKKLLQAASGNAGGDNLYVEDVFATHLYEGNSSTQTITNGLDLAGEGGLVWIKARNSAATHGLYDTERGATKRIDSTTSNGESTYGDSLTGFDASGFSIGARGDLNQNSIDFASWSFRKAEKFFDVVTWTGNGTGGRQIPHSLGSVPGFIITKRTDSADNWKSYHVGNPSPAEDHVIELDNANAAGNEGIFSDTAPTSTNFTVSAGGAINANGFSYVAYLFASDAGGFGDDGSENIIKCGNFTTDGNGEFYVNTGFEPQWVIVKRIDSTGSWNLLDTMRGLLSEGTAGGKYVRPNTSADEATLSSTNSEHINATGFGGNGAGVTGSANATFIYMAIRRPMKTPEAGTEVFTPYAYSGNATADRILPATARTVDLGIVKSSSDAYEWLWDDRLRGANAHLSSNYASGESTSSNLITGLDLQNGIEVGSWQTVNGSGKTQVAYMFTRATGFMDVVAYTGNGASSHALTHNFGVSPELIITKRRNASGDWRTATNFSASAYSLYKVNEVDPATNINYAAYGMYAAKPTSTTFTVGSGANVNSSGETYVSYLFATLAGVSKVGSVVHSGTTDVDCGFSAGARFVMAKRADQNSGWYIWDSVSGIVSGNDPYMTLNTADAEVTNTDYIDPLSSGFTLTSSFTAGTYIFLAIA